MGKYTDIQPGEPGNTKRYAICGSNRGKGRGVCQNVAGLGTDHHGRGRCKFHGGNTAEGPTHYNWKHGIWGDVFKGTLKRAATQVVATADNETLTDLSGELVALRLLALMAWDKMQGGDGLLSSIREEDEDIIDSMLVDSDGGGVVVLSGGKVSSSLARRREKPVHKKREELIEIVKGNKGREAEVIVDEILWKLYGGEGEKEPEYEEMMAVLTHVIAVVKTAKEIEGIRNQDVPTRQELGYAIGVMREVKNEFITDGNQRKAFDNRLMERLGVRSASGT